MNNNISYAGTTENYPVIKIVSKLNDKKAVKNDNKIIKLDKK
tara:strand:+ start:287 stop:412 length:126 start_codon:yes stop_codon:yes gene_type:complete